MCLKNDRTHQRSMYMTNGMTFDCQ